MNISPGYGKVLVGNYTPPSYPYIYSFKSGTEVRLEAIPIGDYHFNNWSGDLSGTTNPTSIIIDCNKSITAHFSNGDKANINWPLFIGITSGVVFVVSLAVILVVMRRT